ncbi:MAG: hypothetical protein RBR98_00980 [Candidatus Moranbacteria bacterium]|jgi:hypothetical protein|nr:hypothetical protein [Candidatus Moranbacteria bacterium]
MQIELTNEQYRQLLELVSLGNGVLGTVGDLSEDQVYEAKSMEGEDMQSYLLGFAGEFDSEDLLKEEMYQEHILPIMMDYEDLVTYDNLSTQLAWRDINREMSEEELNEMVEKYEDQLEEKISAYEDGYRQEFARFGLTHLEVIAGEEEAVEEGEAGEVEIPAETESEEVKSEGWVEDTPSEEASEETVEKPTA